MDIENGHKIPEDLYQENILDILSTLSDKYSVELKPINVHIFHSRQTFLTVINKPRAPDWLIAYIPNNSVNQCYLLNSSSVLDNNFIQILTHELTHLVINTLNKYLPDWIKEGVAVYEAEQIFILRFDENDWRSLTVSGTPFSGILWEDAAKSNGYNIAGLIIYHLNQLFTWTKLINILQEYDPKKDHSFFNTIERITNLKKGEFIEKFVDLYKKRGV